MYTLPEWMISTLKSSESSHKSDFTFWTASTCVHHRLQDTEGLSKSQTVTTQAGNNKKSCTTVIVSRRSGIICWHDLSEESKQFNVKDRSYWNEVGQQKSVLLRCKEDIWTADDEVEWTILTIGCSPQPVRRQSRASLDLSWTVPQASLRHP